MSLKENVDYVKQELNSEEKFLEGFVKIERFYKKYKTLILGLITVLIIASAIYIIKQNIDKNNKYEANIAFEKFLKNPEDKVSLEKLKDSNKNLFEIALFLQQKQKGENSTINVKFLKELNMYKKALNNKSIEDLNNISMENNFLLKEFAIFNKALLLVEKGEYSEAKAALSLIPNTSKVNDLVNLLNHYLVTK